MGQLYTKYSKIHKMVKMLNITKIDHTIGKIDRYLYPKMSQKYEYKKYRQVLHGKTLPKGGIIGKIGQKSEGR